MKLVRTVSSAIEKGYRIIKTKMGKNIVETGKSANPFGFDSKPTSEVIAIVAETQSNDESIIVGYLNIKALESLKIGESAQYSTDENGVIKSTIILRNDGTAELLGNVDNAVRYIPLNTALSTFVDAINLQLKTALAGIPYTWVDVPLDISASKIDEIKTL